MIDRKPEILVQMEAFTHQRSLGHVNCFTVAGRVNGEMGFPPQVQIALFPTRHSSQLDLRIYTTAGSDTTYALQLIDLLMPAERFSRHPKLGDSLLELAVMWQIQLQTSRPVILFALGIDQINKEQMALLYSIRGISPATALVALKDYVKAGHLSFS